MAEKPNQTPKGDDENQTPQGPEGEPTPEKTPKAGEGLPPAPEVDYKKKFSESTKENQRVQAEKERLEEEKAELEAKLAEKAAREAPSDEELAQKYPDWDTMLDTEKMTIRNNEEIRRLKENQAWEADLAKALRWARDNSYTLDTVGFKEFCYSPERRGNKDIISLVKAFVFDQKKPEMPAEPARPGVEPPTGGQAPPDEGKMTVEKARQIRLNNPKLYEKMLLDGRLKAKDIQP